MTDEASATFMRRLAAGNPGEVEFHQAVHEVLESVVPILDGYPDLLNARILRRLVEPERTIIFRVAWVDDEGDIQVNRGFRVEMSSSIGPYKGGLRFHPTVNLGVLKFLAFEQTFKNALTTLPIGSGKGGSDFDPKGKSDMEVMRFCQAFMAELFRHLGDRTDVPAGDIGVGAREIGYLFGQYKKLANEFSGVLTGKGVGWGGSRIRPQATGYGCVYFAEEMLKSRGDSIRGKTCLVSGAGNVAQYTVENIHRLGGQAITLSDSSGFILDRSGIGPEKLAWVQELKNQRRGRISEYADHFGCDYFPNARPWAVEDADCAFPSATQNELEIDDARALTDHGIRLVAEGANMPSTPEAVQHLLDCDVLFGPGKAANAGGVATSALEMAQNASHTAWTRHQVDLRLREIMIDIHSTCYETAREHGSPGNYVAGANIAGFLRVATAMLEQGVV